MLSANSQTSGTYDPLAPPRDIMTDEPEHRLPADLTLENLLTMSGVMAVMQPESQIGHTWIESVEGHGTLALKESILVCTTMRRSVS